MRCFAVFENCTNDHKVIFERPLDTLSSEVPRFRLHSMSNRLQETKNCKRDEELEKGHLNAQVPLPLPSSSSKKYS